MGDGLYGGPDAGFGVMETLQPLVQINVRALQIGLRNAPPFLYSRPGRSPIPARSRISWYVASTFGVSYPGNR